MRILVTGANGFLGSHVVRKLLAQGHETRAFVLQGTPTTSIDHLPAPIVAGDLTGPQNLAPAVEGVDAIIHLAALPRDWGPWEVFRRVNVKGTARLLRAARKAGVGRFVLVSSVAVHAYRDFEDAGEDTPRDGYDLPYGRSKILAEDLVRAAHESGDIEGVVARPGLMPYGPRDRAAFVPLAQALEKGTLPLINGGRARFTTSYAGNLADGLVLAAQHPVAAGNTYLLTDDPPVSWRDFLTAAATALGCRPPRFSLPGWLVAGLGALFEDVCKRLPSTPEPPLTRYRADVVRRNLVFRSDRARDELGYTPEVSLEEGLRRTVDWYRRVESGRRLTGAPGSAGIPARSKHLGGLEARAPGEGPRASWTSSERTPGATPRRRRPSTIS